jgi:kynurenine 3-monooxygenase
LQKKIENGFQISTLTVDSTLQSGDFSDRPYTEALAIGDLQNAIMEEVLKLEYRVSGTDRNKMELLK